LDKQNELVLSVDEKTGIQALEREVPTKAMKSGHIEKTEYNYKRHGTQVLIAGLNVATGIVSAVCLPTRTEFDFTTVIKKFIEDNPDRDKYHFVVDNLNTHKSETLVNFVAEFSDLDQALGVKGSNGILKSMSTREAFLTDKSHKIVFYFTPKHASWMNQIEIWFNILTRKVLKRANFTSIQHLKNSLLDFIDYFNNTMAKPFKWTYQGKVLVV